MLLELRVQNLLLIEHAELRLGPGLTVVTGETGAGKTVLAHALDLLLGGRPRSGIVRPGASEAYVEGVFALPPGLLAEDGFDDLHERLPEGEDEIVLGRRVTAEGRTRAFVQGRSASVEDLRSLGSRLVSFYGQHEHRKLTVASAQLGVLDRFAGPEHHRQCEELRACHRRVTGLKNRLGELRDRAGTRERDRDLLAFELDEIEALGPSEDEHSLLGSERDRLHGLDALRAASASAVEALAPEEADADGVTTLLAAAERGAQAGAAIDADLQGLSERLTALRLEAEDLAADLRRYEADLDAEPGRLDEVEGRLDLYERLERKHGGSVASVIEHAERCRAQLEDLDGFEAAIHAAEADLEEGESELAERAVRVSGGRRRAAPELEQRVISELGALAMGEAAFEVRLEPVEEVLASGAERVELLIAPNPGMRPAPLRETASGGELSRTMLALMSIASDTDGADPSTVVFDEVDAGVGGQTARAVGDRLRMLAAGRQVICITHLPQIASLADAHFRIEKSSRAGVARAAVEGLEGDAVVSELCRMLGADREDAGARRHAEELLAAA